MQPPVYGPFDYDPDGIGILTTYKYSSATLQYESADLECPEMQWLGLKSSELQTAISGDRHGLLPLTPRDRRKASLMLGREPLIEGGNEPEWRSELQVMLFLNFKAEIQILEDRKGGLSDWLKDQELGADFPFDEPCMW
jgi:meiotic recombination protein SPO11